MLLLTFYDIKRTVIGCIEDRHAAQSHKMTHMNLNNGPGPK